MPMQCFTWKSKHENKLSSREVPGDRKCPGGEIVRRNNFFSFLSGHYKSHYESVQNQLSKFHKCPPDSNKCSTDCTSEQTLIKKIHANCRHTQKRNYDPSDTRQSPKGAISYCKIHCWGKSEGTYF